MAHNLSCIECGLLTTVFERGWRGFLTDDEFGPAEVAILCPACAEREFGSCRRALTEDESAAAE